MIALVDALRAPDDTRDWTPEHWQDAILQARNSKLLASLGQRLPETHWPDAPALRRKLESFQVIADANQRSVHWECHEIADALRDQGYPVVLLKGAAYVMRGLPAAAGRFVGDVDLMVPFAALDRCEQRLRYAGYVSGKQNAYDQLYYRKWMHELPPLQHMKRGTVLDLHHNILPRTARAKPQAEHLLAAIEPLPQTPLYTLCPADMVLHSITHLFFDGEWDHALRDLWDIDRLLRHFSNDAFWTTLWSRAGLLDLRGPLCHALPAVQALFATPVPEPLMREALGHFSAGKRVLMQPLFLNASRPDHPSCVRKRDRLARGLLYLRGHWLRMPLHLLLPHLVRKAFRGKDE